MNNLSEEEKQTIRIVNDYLLYSEINRTENDEACELVKLKVPKAMRKVLNLIEKQQKEIEEYKKRLTPTPDNCVPIEYQMIGYVDKRGYISKDKIRAKIKELQDNIPDLKTSTTFVNNIEQIKMLQELLEDDIKYLKTKENKDE